MPCNLAKAEDALNYNKPKRVGKTVFPDIYGTGRYWHRLPYRQT
jgi:hypothetical protein